MALSWKAKFAAVIHNILNTDEDYYRCEFINDTTVVITLDGKMVVKRIAQHFEAHWKEQAREVILGIVTRKINEELKLL